MAGGDGAGSPAQGHGKKLMINQDVGPARWMGTEGRPFNMTVETVDRIAAAGKVDAVTNPTTFKIRVCLCSMRRKVINGMRFCGTDVLLGAADRNQEQQQEWSGELPYRYGYMYSQHPFSHDILHRFSMILYFHDT